MEVGVCFYSIFAKLVSDKMLLVCETYNVLLLKPQIYCWFVCTLYLWGIRFITFFKDNHNITSCRSFIITVAKQLGNIFWTE